MPTPVRHRRRSGGKIARGDLWRPEILNVAEAEIEQFRAHRPRVEETAERFACLGRARGPGERNSGGSA